MTKFKKNATIICLFLMLQIYCTSCARYLAVAQDGLPETDIDGQSSHKANLNVYFWGIVTSPQFNSNKCPGKSFYKVEVKSNVWQSLAGVVTLGIWRPMTVECTCAKTFDNN